MAAIELVMSREEINNAIPYNLICQTRYGSKWDTMRRRLQWNKNFTDNEKERAEKIFRQSHIWSVSKGVPDTVRMDLSTYALWMKIAGFCSSL